jgi:hypothetical protein
MKKLSVVHMCVCVCVNHYSRGLTLSGLSISDLAHAAFHDNSRVKSDAGLGAR